MSPSTREINEQAYAALNRRDLQAFLDVVDPEVEFTSLIAEAEGQTFRGHDGVREWWENVADALGGLAFSVERFQDLGDRGVSTIRVTGTVGGLELSQTMYQALRVREDKAVWWRMFRTQEEALAALEESA